MFYSIINHPKMEGKELERPIGDNRGITLIALVVTIALNCCKAAMARVNNKEMNILKI